MNGYAMATAINLNQIANKISFYSSIDSIQNEMQSVYTKYFFKIKPICI